MKKNGLDNRTRQMKNTTAGFTPKDENENRNNSSTLLFHHYQTMNNLKRETYVDRDTHFQPASPPRRDMAELSQIFQLYNVANARKPYSSTTSNTRGKKMSAIRDKYNGSGATNRIHSSFYATQEVHHIGREQHDTPRYVKQHGLNKYVNRRNRNQYSTVTSAICIDIAEDDISEITTPETIRSS